MAYDLEEQEQLVAIKDWWQRYRTLAISVFSLILLTFLFWQGWHYYRERQAMQAMQIFSTLNEMTIKPLADSTNILMRDYRNTPYAGRAAVLLANAYYKVADHVAAYRALNWASEHATEEAVLAIAKLQLARLLIEDKRPTEALKILLSTHDKGFDGLFSDAKGDALVALHRMNEAKIAYQSALLRLGDAQAYHALTQQKLDALG